MRGKHASVGDHFQCSGSIWGSRTVYVGLSQNKSQCEWVGLCVKMKGYVNHIFIRNSFWALDH